LEISLKIKDVVFPGDSVVKNPLDNIGDMSSIPNLRGFQCGGAAKPELHAIEPVLWSLAACILHLLKPVLRDREATATRSPHLPQLERAQAQQ